MCGKTRTWPHVGASSLASHDAFAASSAGDGPIDTTSTISCTTLAAEPQLAGSCFASHLRFASSSCDSASQAASSPARQRSDRADALATSATTSVSAAAASPHAGASSLVELARGCAAILAASAFTDAIDVASAASATGAQTSPQAGASSLLRGERISERIEHGAL